MPWALPSKALLIMRLLHYLPLLVVPALVAGCAKEEDGTTPPPTNATPSIADFSKLQVGNYWIYERGSFDSLNNYLGPGTIDSVVVTGEGEVNGEPAFFLTTNPADPFPTYQERFISGNRLLDENGRVLYCTDPSDATIWTEPADNGTTQVDWFLASGTTPVLVGTTSFSARTWIGRRTTSGGGDLDDWYDQVSLWVPGVGLVLTKEMPDMWPIAGQRRLLRYHVQ
ncbi:MAG: hypothetical protein WAU70_03960 [Flavobacteriales bacterium]